MIDTEEGRTLPRVGVWRSVRVGVLTVGLLLGLASCTQVTAELFRDIDQRDVRYSRGTIIARGAGPNPPSDSLLWRTTPLTSALSNLDRMASVDQRVPVSLTIESLGVSRAPIDAVGVLDTGEMAVPPPTRVGWYSYGASPGEEGAAVLAAHVAYNGIDGVFVDLTKLEVATTVVVNFDDGSIKSFSVDSLDSYDKDELPKKELFAREGRASLVLITCGGAFQPALASFEDNIVAIAS